MHWEIYYCALFVFSFKIKFFSFLTYEMSNFIYIIFALVFYFILILGSRTFAEKL